MQCVVNVGEMLEELAGRECEVREGDERFRGGVRDEFYCRGYEWKKCVNRIWIGDNGAGASEGGCERGEGARLVGQMGCESVVGGLESGGQSALASLGRVGWVDGTS